jgi:formylglycine-generating enzyme required for sulfatase activity
MAVEVFYSYSHRDEDLRSELDTHLALLKRRGLIQSWTDHCIGAGDEWRSQIDEHVRSASVILLLISPDFMASDYCFDVEMRIALERHEAKDAIVIPVLLRSCDWSGAPFSKLQALPRGAKAVTSWANRDEAFTAIAKELRERVSQKAEDDTLARKKYLAWVASQHRYIRFSGMAVVDERAEVEMARVFVMPRVIPQEREKPEPVVAHGLLAEQDGPGRLMILGGPGSGKTTLLEAFALAFVQPENFAWAQRLPKLLPVFYRIRDLDKDLQETRGTIWECIQHHCCRGMQDALPTGFFLRQMRAGGVALLFDGLDEASSPARRNEIVELIGALAGQLSAGSRLIVTSRPHDYRHRFEGSSWAHLDLAEFDDDEIQKFIAGWQKIHQPDRTVARDKGKDLWQALESRPDILPLARNALLLTMIVRVHFGLGALPDSRLGLYEKCTETLLKHWAEAKGLVESPINTAQKRKLLQRLAYEMQGEVEQLTPDMTLQMARSDLERRLDAYLDEEGCADHFHLAEEVIERLHARDAILVQYGAEADGQDKFGFVHRSFQEYFAAGWLAHEIEEEEFRRQLFAGRDGWDETFYLAVAQLPDRRRRSTLLELLKRGQADVAVECLKAAVPEQPWLRLLVHFLARYRSYQDLSVAECADACAARPETMTVLGAMFEHENREGRCLAAAVELAEELRRRGNQQAGRLLDEFFAEAKKWPEDMVVVAAGAFPYGKDNEMVDLAAFRIDRFPVTNEEFERMAPGHRRLRSKYSDADRQPVIMVNWFEARLYARWRGCRLPSEEEWEKAAGWDADAGKKRVYPWGDEFDAAFCNTYESGIGKTTAVGSYSNYASPCGAQDMAGNVWEWTESAWSEGDETRVVRGGSWLFNRDDAACAYRSSNVPDDRVIYYGFRCART